MADLNTGQWIAVVLALGVLAPIILGLAWPAIRARTPQGWAARYPRAAPWVFGAVLLVALAWGALFLLTLGFAFVGLMSQLFGAEGAVGGVAGGLGFGALLVGLLGAPFLVWTTIIKQTTLSVARDELALSKESVFNDKVSEAVEALYSRRQVTRVISVKSKDGDEEKVLTEWQDDILKRSAAIDRLEGLVRERPSEATRIAGMLSLYVRELSRENAPRDHPRQAWMRLVEPGDDSPPLSEFEALHKAKLHPDDVTVEAIRTWARNLIVWRADVQQAVRTLGRLKDIAGVDEKGVRIDLRGANLQGFDIADLNFRDAVFSHARMEGVKLWGAHMEGADLQQARMEGADLSRARMAGSYLGGVRVEGANLSWARMEGATLIGARMEGADLSWAQMAGADLRQARLEGADLSCVRMDVNTDLSGATLRGAALRGVTYPHFLVSQDQVNASFGDASVTLPPGIERPTYWPEWTLPDEWPGTPDVHSYHSEWRRWQADPANYTPPP